MAGVFVIALLLAGAGWRDLTAARSRLLSAKATLDQIAGKPSVLTTAGGRTATVQQLSFAVDEVDVSHRIVVGSFALKVARFVPFLSTQRSGLLRLVNDSDVALLAGRNLVVQVDSLVAEGQVTGAQVPVSALAKLETDLHNAGSTIVGLDRSGTSLIGPLGKARRQFDTLANSTGTRLLNDADAVAAGRTLLGSGGVRRYFMALENNAEMRDQGAILSYALITVDDGHVQVSDHGSVYTPIQVPGAGATLLLKSPAPVAIPPGTARVFGSIDPTETWPSVNATADFDFTGRAIQAMYREATGQTVDGVIALDVPALSSLLSVVGPVMVPDIGEEITAGNASTVILHDLYNSFPDNQQVVRKELLSEVVTEVVNRLAMGSFDPLPLAQQLATSAAGGHLKVWSDVAPEEAELEKVGLGGGPGVTDADRTFHLAVENRNATKVDYYVKTALEQQVTITKVGAAIIHSTIVVYNGAPVGAAPSYQLGPDRLGTTEPGEYWAWVLLWAPAGSDQPLGVPESGLELTQTVVPRIYAGQTAEVTFVTVIDNAVQHGRLNLRYVPQPRLTPPALSVTIDAPGWNVGGKATFAGSWDRTINLTWSLSR